MSESSSSSNTSNNAVGIYKSSSACKGSCNNQLDSRAGVGLKPNEVSADTYITVSSWLWREWSKLFGYDEGLLKYVDGRIRVVVDNNCFNRLRSLSYGAAKYLYSYGRYKRFVPGFGSVNDVADRVVEELGFDSAVFIYGPARTGKSTGGLLGTMRWVIERDVTNYTVIVLTATRRLAFQLYENAVGFWTHLLKVLSNVAPENSQTLARRMKVILYLGGEMSCLRGLRCHTMEECFNCEYFRRYGDYWRSFPNVPYADNIMLMAAGYCPFQALYNYNFLHNSIIITTYDSLPVLLSALESVNRRGGGIKKIILFVDEWLVYLERKRVRIKHVEAGEYPEEVRELINRYNTLVDSLIKVSKEYYSGVYRSCPNLTSFGDMLSENLVSVSGARLEYVRRILGEMKGVLGELEEAVKGLDASKRLKVLRLVRQLRSRLSVSMVFYDERSKKFYYYTVLYLQDDGRGDVSVFTHGNELHSVIEELRKKGYVVGFVGTTIVKPVFKAANYVIVPHIFNRVSLVRTVKVKRYVPVATMFSHVDQVDAVKGLRTVKAVVDTSIIFTDACSPRSFDAAHCRWNPGVHLVLLNKRLMLATAEWLRSMFGGERVKVVGDISRGVIDYVVVDLSKEFGVTIVLAYPYGRLSFGIDLPFEPDYVHVLGGVKRNIKGLPYVELDATDVVGKALPGGGSSVDAMHVRRLAKFSRLFRKPAQAVLKGNDLAGRVHSILEVYSRGRGAPRIRIYIYDYVLSYYDAHLVMQVVGRVLLKRLRYLVVLGSYYGMLMETGMVGDLTLLMYTGGRDVVEELGTDFVFYLDDEEVFFRPNRVEDILGKSVLPVDINRYYKSRSREYENLEKYFRKHPSEWLAAKIIVWLYRVSDSEEKVRERVVRLPEELVMKARRFFRAVNRIARWLGL